MAGRFRFTPACCCGGTCWCIPDCDEIFRGFYNLPAHLRDADTDVQIARTYILRDLSATYNSFDGEDCSFFDVITKTVDGSPHYFARPTGSVFHPSPSYGNHLLHRVHYSCPEELATNARWGWYWNGSSYQFRLRQEGVFASRVAWYYDRDSGQWKVRNTIWPGYRDASDWVYDGPRVGDLWTAPRQVTGTILTSEVLRFPSDGFDALMTASRLAHRTFDSYLHTKGTLNSYRIYCLPFRYDLYPFPCGSGDIDIIETGLVGSINDLYVPAGGTGEGACDFEWPAECNATGALADLGIIAADELTETLERLLENEDLLPEIDQVTVRLYGLTSPVRAEGAWGTSSYWHEKWIDACHGAEFVVKIVEDSSGEKHLVPMGDIGMADYTMDHQSLIDEFGTLANYNKTSYFDVPSEMVYYSRLIQETWGSEYPEPYRWYLNKWAVRINHADMFGYDDGTYHSYYYGWGDVRPPFRYDERNKGLDARIVFGNVDATEGEDSAGDESTIPTKWHTPKPDETYTLTYRGRDAHTEEVPNRQPDNDITERFHGIYWVWAQIAPCRDAFRSEVTHGTLWRVPVAEFDVDDEWDDSTIWSDSTYPLIAADLTLSDASENFNYSTLHREFMPTSNPPAYLDAHKRRRPYPGREYYYRPYIVKPDGWRLNGLVWRVFLTEASALSNGGGDRSIITTLPAFDLVGDRITMTKDPSTGEITSVTDSFYRLSYGSGEDAGVGGLVGGCIGPYTKTGIGFNGIGFNAPGGNNDNQGNDFKWSRFAYENGYNLHEQSVNGNGYTTIEPGDITDPDDALYGKTLYFPTLSQEKVEQLLGESIRLIYDMNSAKYMYYDEQRKEDGLNGSTHTYTYYENVKLYVHYNIAYMAVWAPESQS